MLVHSRGGMKTQEKSSVCERRLKISEVQRRERFIRGEVSWGRKEGQDLVNQKIRI